MNGPDQTRAERLLLATHQLLQEINGDVVKWWKVDPYFASQKVITFAFAIVLS